MYPAGILLMGIAVILLDSYLTWREMRQGH
jgi:hypothetical protein